jgi:hypothetical protein
MSHSVDKKTDQEVSRVRQKFGPVIRAVLFSALSFTGCLAFQNCSTYGANNNALYDNQAVVSCIGLTCQQDDSLLRISINNDNPVAIKTGNVAPGALCGTDDSVCVDLGGTCEDGGFSDNLISYSITGGTVQTGEAPLAAKCVNGRFNAQIALPVGYDFPNVHTIRLTIYGIDHGQRVTSSSGGNFREVSVAAYN